MNRIDLRLLLVVFCPFSAGYFLSYFFRNVNAVISRDLTAAFSLSAADLGLLTAGYFLAFAAFQLPLGVLLDRYGPRRVVAALLCIAALGALVFGLAQNLVMLSIGRALIGLGVAGCLMGAIKAFTLWFPPSRLATLTGVYIGVGGLGGLTATAPVEAMLGPLGWRGVFYGLAGLSLAVALVIFTVVPEKPARPHGESFARQAAAFRQIFVSTTFLRIALPFVTTHATYQALIGLWIAPWLYDIAGFDRGGVAQTLFAAATAYTIGSVFFGAASDQLARKGIPHLTVYKFGMLVTLAMFCLIAAGVTAGITTIAVVYGFFSISGALGFALLTPRFPIDMAGRVNTAINVMMFSASFVFQWGIGAVLRGFPVVDGRYASEGYATALIGLGVVQFASIAWLMTERPAPPPAE